MCGQEREEGLEEAGREEWERGSRERRESKGEQRQKGEAGREERSSEEAAHFQDVHLLQ